MRRAATPKPWNFKQSFRHPEGMDRVALGAVRAIAEGLCGGTGARLSALLRCRAHLDLEDMEQGDREGFESRVEAHAGLATFQLEPGGGAVYAHLPIDLAMTVLDLMLAGSGAGPFPSRPLSEMERKLIAPFYEVLAQELAGSCSAVLLAAQSSPVSQLTGLQSLPPRNKRDPCVLMRFSLRLSQGHPRHKIDLCVPVTTIRPLLRGLARDPSRPQSEQAARRIPLDLCLRYPPVAIPMTVAEALEPGQVVSLGHPLESPLFLCVGDRPLFTATPMAEGRRAACQIIAAVNPEE